MNQKLLAVAAIAVALWPASAFAQISVPQEPLNGGSHADSGYDDVFWEQTKTFHHDFRKEAMKLTTKGPWSTVIFLKQGSSRDAWCIRVSLVKESGKPDLLAIEIPLTKGMPLGIPKEVGATMAQVTAFIASHEAGQAKKSAPPGPKTKPTKGAAIPGIVGASIFLFFF